MKAIVIPNPNEIEIREIPMPEVKEGEALLKVKYVGICGADVASFTGNQPFTTYPRIPGHEFSAEIGSQGRRRCYLQPLFQLRRMLFMRKRIRQLLHRQPDNGCSA